MKMDLFPEDILLEYTEKLLAGEVKPKLSSSRYFNQFPETLEFSEEFAERWQKLVEPVVKKFISDTFSLHQFLFDADGYVKKFCATNSEFWESIDLKFSHRGVLRMYERMLEQYGGVGEPLYLVATPSDALFLSIAIADFDQYSYQWFEKNAASWVVSALFIAWQNVSAEKVPWKCCFDSPGGVHLQVRGFLLERAGAYFSCVNHLIRSAIETHTSLHTEFSELSSERSGAGLPLRFVKSTRVANVISAGKELAKSIHSAVEFWSGTGTLALDDDRFIKGIYNTSGLAEELNEFEAVVKEYSETRGMEESVHESVIFN